MGKVAVDVGQHHLIRSYLPAVIGVLLTSALLLLGAGAILEHHLEYLARGMAQRGAPGHQVAGELDVAVGQAALDSALLGETGDERALNESESQLEAAANAYDGWTTAAKLEGAQPVLPAVRAFEERLAVANAHPGKTDALEVERAYADMTDVLGANRHLAVADASKMLDRIAVVQQRRRFMEMAVMALLAGGCIALLVAARRREERECNSEKNAVRHLEQTNADLEAFAGRVAHDLRNPLVPILSGSQVIERAAVDGQVRRAAERIERSARRIASMIDALLDFSRLAAAQPPTQTEVGPVVEEVVDGFREKARMHDVSLCLTCEPQLRVLAEPIVLASALQNLVENALKYGQRPGVEPVIEVRAFHRAGMVIIEVEDRGPGISAEEAETLFHAFSRSKEGGEGVGLGLATARRLVEARGGSIGLRAGRFGGALFQIRLPSVRSPTDVELVTSEATGALHG